MNKEYATFDKNGVYEQEIAPLITELKRISSENRIPFFAAFGTMMENGKFDTIDEIISLFKRFNK